MRLLLAAALLLGPSRAFSRPMPEKCLPFAPKSCGLTDESDAAAMLACFDEERGLLSPRDERHLPCLEELAHARVHARCDGEDVPRFCGEVKPGNDRLMSCLRAHSDDVSPSCRASLSAYDETAAALFPEIAGGSKKARGKKPGARESPWRKKGRGPAVSSPRC